MSSHILVLCTGNSCRSQMAEGYLRRALPSDVVYSAGIVARGLNPLAVRVMSEDQVDISHQSSKTIDSLPDIAWDVVITVCDNAREQCPVLPGRHTKLHRAIDDPAAFTGTDDNVLPEYRRVRDEIRAFTEEFVDLDILSLKNI